MNSNSGGSRGILNSAFYQTFKLQISYSATDTFAGIMPELEPRQLQELHYIEWKEASCH
jgi:hypothetical protein